MSTTLHLPVDVERLLYGFLMAQAELTAITTNIVTEWNSDLAPPVLRYGRVGGGPPAGVPLWLDMPRVQFDCYGGTKNASWHLAATAQAMLERLLGAHPEGVVSNIDYGTAIDLPDGDFDPPLPRYVWDAVITTHP